MQAKRGFPHKPNILNDIFSGKKTPPQGAREAEHEKKSVEEDGTNDERGLEFRRPGGRRALARKADWGQNAKSLTWMARLD